MVQGSADAQAGSAQRESVLAIVAALAEEEAEQQLPRRAQPGDYLVSKSWLMYVALSPALSQLVALSSGGQGFPPVTAGVWSLSPRRS